MEGSQVCTCDLCLSVCECGGGEKVIIQSGNLYYECSCFHTMAGLIIIIHSVSLSSILEGDPLPSQWAAPGSEAIIPVCAADSSPDRSAQ